jgi:hypothetical protein
MLQSETRKPRHDAGPRRPGEHHHKDVSLPRFAPTGFAPARFRVNKVYPISAQKFVTYYVTILMQDRCKRTREAIMPFELIMLLGFFGTALLAQLPATPDTTAAGSCRRRRRQGHGVRRQRADGGRRPYKGKRAAAQASVRRGSDGWPAAV